MINPQPFVEPANIYLNHLLLIQIMNQQIPVCFAQLAQIVNYPLYKFN